MRLFAMAVIPGIMAKKRSSAGSTDQPVHGWGIYRLRGTPAAFIGIVYAPDEKTALAKAIEEFEIEPQHQGRLIAQRRD